MMRVLRVDRDVAGMTAGRRPWAQCEHPAVIYRDSMGGTKVGFCPHIVCDAARVQGCDEPFTRYLCREHGDEYAREVQQ